MLAWFKVWQIFLTAFLNSFLQLREENKKYQNIFAEKKKEAIWKGSYPHDNVTDEWWCSEMTTDGGSDHWICEKSLILFFNISLTLIKKLHWWHVHTEILCWMVIAPYKLCGNHILKLPSLDLKLNSCSVYASGLSVTVFLLGIWKPILLANWFKRK